MNCGFFHNSAKADRIAASASSGVFGGMSAVRNIATMGSLKARSTSYDIPDGGLPLCTVAWNSSKVGRSAIALLRG